MIQNKIQKITRSINTYWQIITKQDKPLLDDITKDILINANYHTNSIEGNHTTLTDVEAIISGNETLNMDMLLERDISEIRGQDAAYLYLIKIAQNTEFITEAEIRNLHKILLGEGYRTNGIDTNGNPIEILVKTGTYKTRTNSVKKSNGEIFHYAAPSYVASLMLEWHRNTKNKLENFRKIKTEINQSDVKKLFLFLAELHYDFIIIHPFEDGNGRMVRMMINYILLKLNLPILIFRNETKKEYFQILEKLDSKEINYDEFVVFLIEHYQKVFTYIERRVLEKLPIRFETSETEVISRQAKSLVEQITSQPYFAHPFDREKLKIELVKTYLQSYIKPLFGHLRELEYLFGSYQEEVEDLKDAFNYTSSTKRDLKDTFEISNLQSNHITIYVTLQNYRIPQRTLSILVVNELLFDNFYIIYRTEIRKSTENGMSSEYKHLYTDRIKESDFEDSVSLIMKNIFEAIQKTTQ